MKFRSTAPFIIFALSFSLNLVWEFAQMPLYNPPFGGWVRILVTLAATVGDALFAVVLYFLIARFAGRNWFVMKPSYAIAAVVISLVSATLVEISALYAGLWAYSDLMPIVPVLGVGLSPFIQLATLSLASFALSVRLFRASFDF